MSAPSPRPPATLFEIFERSAQAHPDAIAIDLPPTRTRASRRSLSYAQLRDLVAQIAAAAPPVEQGAIIALVMARDSERLYAAQLAVMSLGAAYLCIDPSLPDERARFLLEDSAAASVWTELACAARVARWGVGADSAWMLDADRSTRKDGAPPRVDGRGSDLAYVIYTSGTTGKPKGVLIEQQGIVNLVLADRDEFGLAPGDRVAQGSSASYDSSVEETWLAFASGACVVVLDDETLRSGPDLVDWLERENIDAFCPPPTLLRAMAVAEPTQRLPRLRLVYVGGEAMPADLADAWAVGRRLENGYGPTECSVTVVRGTLRAGQAVTIGRAVRGNRAHVLDGELRELPDGEVGELCIAGVGLARGYLRRAELEAAKFPVHPQLGRLYRTGDLARRRSDGELEYLGRIDAQVKLRGHRIELEEVDSHLAALPGVLAAASAVQREGPEALLVGFVVARDPSAPPELDGLLAQLRARVPDVLVPARLALLPRLPTSVGGKLARHALPRVEIARAGETAGAGGDARDEIEREIAGAFRGALALANDPRRDANFFHELGGSSLGAALAISRLRQDPRTAQLSVRDLYAAPSVAELAACLRRSEAEAPAPTQDRAHDPADSNGQVPTRATARPSGAAFVQLPWLVSRIWIGAAVWVGVTQVAQAGLEARLSTTTLLSCLPIAVLLALTLGFVASVAVAVITKRVCIGRYSALRAPVWGSFYRRNWIVQQSVRAIPWTWIQGTELQNAVLRALGARIGRNVHLHRGVDVTQGGFDLLTIEDDVAIEQEASLRLIEYEDGEVIVAPLRIGRGACLEVRAGMAGGSELGSGAQLAALSVLPRGARVPAGERWDGVPATRVGRATTLPSLDDPARVWGPWSHAARVVSARAAAAIVTGYLPAMLLSIAFAALLDLDRGVIAAWMHAPSFAPGVFCLASALLVLDTVVALGLRALLCRALGRVEPGVVSLRSFAHLRSMLKTEWLDGASHWLSGTLFWPWWLRAAGMRIGKNCEVSTIIDSVPELIELGEESFLADGIYLGGARLGPGCAQFQTTRLGARSFVGNHAVIPSGAKLPDDVLIGVSTLADPRIVRPGSSWFGHPAFELPRREIHAVDRALTHEPSAIRRVNRVFWEALRLGLPIAPLALGVLWLRGVGDSLDAATFAWRAPLATLGFAASLCLAVLLLKWTLLGRVRPGSHVLWSCWCSRWDFLYVAWTQWALGVLGRMEGTPLLVVYLRAIGCRIGKRAVLGPGFAQVVDPDMLVIEDDATVIGAFQAHTFEDRVLKIDRVVLGRRSTLGAGAVMFYGAELGEGTRVAPHSVVMKHERLLAWRRYSGCPTRPDDARVNSASKRAASLAQS